VCVESTNQTWRTIARAVLSIFERDPDIAPTATIVGELLQYIEAIPIEQERAHFFGIIARFWQADSVEFQPAVAEDVVDLTAPVGAQ
jgi:hypothetical protein